MPKHPPQKEKTSAAKAVIILLLSICGIFLFEPMWTYLTAAVETAAVESKEEAPSFISAFLPTGASDKSSSAASLELEGVYPEPKEGFLPVCFGRNTEEKIVALTIDDCNQALNLQQIVQIISANGGKGTIFPIGQNVSSLASILRDAVEKGFEIENHTQSHAGLYGESDEELAYQIWQQNREVSLALGVDYQMHFLRPRGGDNRYDQRTHTYMRQMGYCAIAYWTQEGSLSTADEIMARLKTGDIILFHTTDYDLSVIAELVPKLRAAGYRMVTLNEMFDLPENEQSELTENAAVMPLADYDRFDQGLKRGDYLHDVLLMQQRLKELGYLSGSADGCFGENTEKAVMQFQQDRGLEASGRCDAAVWNALFAQ